MSRASFLPPQTRPDLIPCFPSALAPTSTRRWVGLDVINPWARDLPAYCNRYHIICHARVGLGHDIAAGPVLPPQSLYHQHAGGQMPRGDWARSGAAYEWTRAQGKASVTVCIFHPFLVSVAVTRFTGGRYKRHWSNCIRVLRKTLTAP